ncbi:hypothetical conserved protein [Candidatus Nitrosoglobus terrae]|uniref:Hypothetical conserved protein n=1 Tax=Candidatus Nitrosoglobus terrae TaxID=1630141 RepID=A0A1Q2SKE7_9GAMM|nr:hypothetical protein [Candidatus Nitrosoglobus terrae]BAW79625.1 hypothetical conserved protein [Candidatus Nitrosoglobus terrae]
MLATTIDTPNIPPLQYPVVQQIQATAESPIPTYIERPNKGFHYISSNSSTVTTRITNLLKIEQLGWSELEALETYLRLRNFADDWDAPGMEAYDDL